MKIAVLSDGLPPHQRGGAEAVVERLAKEYARRGHSVAVITTSQSREDIVRGPTERLQVHRIYASYHPRWTAYRGLYNPQTLPALARVLIEESPDVAHAHNVHRYLSYHSLKVASSLNIPTLLTFHDSMAFDYGKSWQGVDPGDLSDAPAVTYKTNALRMLALNRFRYLPARNSLIRFYLHHHTTMRFAVSDELGTALSTNGVHCTGTIHNGIDPSEFATTDQDVAAFSAKHGLNGKKAVLFAGRLSSLKGGEQIVRAMSRVHAEIPEAALLLLGHQERAMALMHSLAERAGIGAQVIRVGWLTGPELLAAYGVCQVVVVPSIYLDPFPTVNIEAMAMRKPVVGTVFGGTKEIVVDGETGYIVNPFNVDRLASRIIELLSDERKAKAMGEAGYRRVRDNFTIHKCAGRYLEIFEGLLEKNAAPVGQVQ